MAVSFQYSHQCTKLLKEYVCQEKEKNSKKALKLFKKKKVNNCYVSCTYPAGNGWE